jgi:hypothetical protein
LDLESGIGEIYFNSFGRKVFWRFLALPVQFLNFHKIRITLGQISKVRDCERRRLRSQGLRKTMSTLALLLAGMTPRTTFIPAI